MYLLFYSTKCKYSLKFIELLQKVGEDKFFESVEVKKINGKYDKRIKFYNVKEVPTVLVNGELIVGAQAFKWLTSKIKNINHSVSTLNTRANKVPLISGYSADISSASLSETQFDGNSSYSSLNNFQKIDTPNIEQEYEKTPFVLPNDNITDGNVQQDTRQDKVSKIDFDMERLLEERKKDLGSGSRRF
jgi:hypothetical protein